MTTAEARRAVTRVWEVGNTGNGADLAAVGDLEQLVERGVLATWRTDGGEWFMVTAAGKEFIGARKGR